MSLDRTRETTTKDAHTHVCAHTCSTLRRACCETTLRSLSAAALGTEGSAMTGPAAGSWTGVGYTAAEASESRVMSRGTYTSWWLSTSTACTQRGWAARTYRWRSACATFQDTTQEHTCCELCTHATQHMTAGSPRWILFFIFVTTRHA